MRSRSTSSTESISLPTCALRITSRARPQTCSRPDLAVGAWPSDNRDNHRSSVPAPSRPIIIRQPPASRRRAFVVQSATVQHVHVFLVSQGEALFQRARGSVEGDRRRTRRGCGAGHRAQDGADGRAGDQDRRPLDRGLRQGADRKRTRPQGFVRSGSSGSQDSYHLRQHLCLLLPGSSRSTSPRTAAPILRPASSAYSSSLSTPTKKRPSSLEATPVVPDPQKGSHTRSPSLLEARMARRTRRRGWYFSSEARNASSARLRSVTSRTVARSPPTFGSSKRLANVPSTQRHVPSLCLTRCSRWRLRPGVFASFSNASSQRGWSSGCIRPKGS